MHGKLPFLLLYAALPFAPASAEDLAGIAAKAAAEGRLVLSGLSTDRCNYAAILDGFAAGHPGIDVDVVGRVETAHAALRGGEADVVMMDIVEAEAARADGLLQSFVPYQLNELPPNTYDLGYAWGGVYFEVAAFAVNAERVTDVPRTWDDLADPSHRGQIGLAHDPAGSDEGALLVAAAGSATAAPGDDPAMVGLDFFAGLAASGNLVTSPIGVESLLDGTVPILVLLDTEAMRLQQTAGETVRVVVPSRSVIPEIAVQAISAAAPHPNAARLWAEYIFHNEPQMALLEGYCHPIRWSDFSQWDMLTEAQMSRLPPSLPYDTVSRFPAADEVAARRAIVSAGWGRAVGQR
jgi:putative spermidine/putrescine transport system substrate-binding protein